MFAKRSSRSGDKGEREKDRRTRGSRKRPGVRVAMKGKSGDGAGGTWGESIFTEKRKGRTKKENKHEAAAASAAPALSPPLHLEVMSGTPP